MTTRREQILRATGEAAAVFSRFPVGNRTSFDIVGATTELGIPLLFRPLARLWGASVTVGESLRGVIVTTKLGLAVQRFTLAHELGHVLLGHQTSLDETIGFAGRYGPSSRPIEEFAADTFASELLAPRSLMLAASKAHRWTKQALTDSANVYQLALRLGVSFQAACWALAAHGVVAKKTAEALQGETVKDLKLALASEALIENSWADVWRLTQGDSGTMLEAGPNDVFAVHLQDDASAGYLWQLVDTGSNATVVEERTSDVTAYGAGTARVVFLRFTCPGLHRLVFEHRRPWNKQRLAHIDIALDNNGKEVGGFSRRLRERALAEAVGP
ncbi:MAG: ImmA/IrrE family metallo-endopeptidase [Planctomycetota bacterium]